jgi:hypothetical protein
MDQEHALRPRASRPAPAPLGPKIPAERGSLLAGFHEHAVDPVVIKIRGNPAGLHPTEFRDLRPFPFHVTPVGPFNLNLPLFDSHNQGLCSDRMIQ